MIIKLLKKICDFCGIEIKEEQQIKQDYYDSVLTNMPSKYIHHLEDPEDYYYHPFEF